MNSDSAFAHADYGQYTPMGSVNPRIPLAARIPLEPYPPEAMRADPVGTFVNNPRNVEPGVQPEPRAA